MTARTTKQGRCSPESGRSGDVSLEVLSAPTIRKSRAGRWRALVLVLVHVLIAIHVVHWMRSGSTMTPLEPSEAMEFSKNSVVNAGLIFFLLMIGSTLVLGRWFCGWACHLVALQDGSRWLLGKAGMKPRPVRLGILAMVPLIAFVYMFLGPLIFRLMIDDPLGVRHLALETESFWRTFPPWIPATLTLLTCGFFVVYLLGAKGFCTYGCPYGAIFGLVDQLAPARIRVTDACEGCGHCTAVCSSNVRVHEEVRDFGMVVDPGCMKCLDCVSVCPNDALYFGFGAPSMIARPRTPARREASSANDGLIAQWALIIAFSLASFGLMTAFDGDFMWSLTLVMTAGTAILAFIFAGKSKRIRDYALGEQALICVFFLGTLFVFRGLYGIPYLFSLGIAAIGAYLLYVLAATLYRPNLNLHRWRLKRHGRWQRAATGYAIFMALALTFTAHGAVVQYHTWSVRHQLQHLVALPAGTVIGADTLARIETAEHHLDRADARALVPDRRRDITRAQLARMRGDAVAYERALTRVAETIPDDAGVRRELATLYMSQGRPEEAVRLYERATEREPDDLAAWVDLGQLLATIGRLPEARAAFERAAAVDEASASGPFNIGMLDMMEGRTDEAIVRFQRAVDLDDEFLAARENLAGALCASGEFEAGIREFLTALDQHDDSGTRELLARAYLMTGNEREAARHLEAAALAAPRPELFLQLADLAARRGDEAEAARWRDKANR